MLVCVSGVEEADRFCVAAKPLEVECAGEQQKLADEENLHGVRFDYRSSIHLDFALFRDRDSFEDQGRIVMTSNEICLLTKQWMRQLAICGSVLLTCPLAVIAQTPATPASVTTPSKGETANVKADVSNSHAAMFQLIDQIDAYHPKKQLKGEAILSGSTTMMILGKSWADGFRNFHKDVLFSRGPDGTDAGLKALAENPALIVGASRPISDSEIAMLKSGKCKDPISLIVALDPLALFVNESNSLNALSPEQLEGILRAPNQKNQHISKWGELGIQGSLAEKEIRLHTRSEISGTTSFIRQFILRGDEIAKEAQSHTSNQEICDAIAKDAAGVGIAGLSDARPGVKPVSLVIRGQIIPATEQSFLAGQYPLVRPLVLVFDKSQMGQDGGLREAILRYVLSRDGQLEAVRAGFFPMDPSFIHQELDLICGPRLR